MKLERELKIWECVKAKAVANWNGLKYKEACDILGLEPEFIDLYEQGSAEVISLKNNSRHGDKYSEFYEKAIKLNDRDLRRDIDEKKRLLQKYFPRRFENNGKQPIADMEDAKVGRLFAYLVAYAKKKGSLQ